MSGRAESRRAAICSSGRFFSASLPDLRPALFSFHNQRNTYFDVLMNEMRLAILDTVDCQRLFPKPRQKV